MLIVSSPETLSVEFNLGGGVVGRKFFAKKASEALRSVPSAIADLPGDVARSDDPTRLIKSLTYAACTALCDIAERTRRRDAEACVEAHDGHEGVANYG
eukprot:3661498-Prymnesium_polylepis.1